MKKPWEHALVTGASSGIGRAIAQYLAAAGTNVTLVARSEEGLKETASAAPDRMDIMPLDLSKTKDLNSLVGFIEIEPIDFLINNAGIWSFGEFASQAPKDISQMLEVNIVALTKLCRAGAEQMCKRKNGAILNVSSIAGGQPLAYEALYGATKSFVTSFSQGLHSELKKYGVTVTALLPGLVKTELFERGKGTESVEKMPEFLWMDPWPVAEAAVKAVAQGKAICIPGAANKVMSNLVEITPRPLLRAFSNQAMKIRRPNK